jgi:hypothetical protein
MAKDAQYRSKPHLLRRLLAKLQIQLSERPSYFALRHVWDGYTISNLCHGIYGSKIIPNLNLSFDIAGHASIPCQTAFDVFEVALIQTDFGLATACLREILANSAGVTCAQLTRDASNTMRQIVAQGVDTNGVNPAFYDRDPTAAIIVNQYMLDNPQGSTAPAFAVYNLPAHFTTKHGSFIKMSGPVDCIDVLQLLVSQACRQYLDWLSLDTSPALYKATILLIKPDGDRSIATGKLRYRSGSCTTPTQRLANNAFARLYTAQFSRQWLESVTCASPAILGDPSTFKFFPQGFHAQSSQLIVLGPKPHIWQWNREREENWLPPFRNFAGQEALVGLEHANSFKRPWLQPIYDVDAINLILNAALEPCEDYFKQVFEAKERADAEALRDREKEEARKAKENDELTMDILDLVSTVSSDQDSCETNSDRKGTLESRSVEGEVGQEEVKRIESPCTKTKGFANLNVQT